MSRVAVLPVQDSAGWLAMKKWIRFLYLVAWGTSCHFRTCTFVMTTWL